MTGSLTILRILHFLAEQNVSQHVIQNMKKICNDSSSEETSPKKGLNNSLINRTTDICDPAFRVPFKYGWKRELVSAKTEPLSYHTQQIINFIAGASCRANNEQGEGRSLLHHANRQKVENTSRDYESFARRSHHQQLHPRERRWVILVSILSRQRCSS